MVDFLSPGTKVQQIRKGPVVLPAIATAIGGFLVYAEKGPVGKPVKVVSPADAAEIFGGRITSPGNSRLTDALQDFFEQGGASCYVNRFIGAGSASAARNLSTTGGATSGAESSNASSFPLAFAPGDTFIGKVDGGGATTLTINATRATKTGAAATYAAVPASSTLVVAINGISGNQTITFDGTEATQAAFLAQINAQLRGASAIDSGGQIRLQTDVFGSSAGGSIVSGAAAVLASTGLSAGAFTNAGPNNVATVDAVTAAEIAALFAGFVGSTTVANSNNSVTWTSNTTGAASSVQFTGGTGTAKVAGFDLALHSGTNSSTIPTITLTATSPGTWGNLIGVLSTKKDTPVTKVGVTAAGATTTLIVTSASRLSIGDTISITKLADTQRSVIKLINGTTVTLNTSITVPVGGYAGTEDVVLETFDITLYAADGTVLFPSPFRNLRMSPLAGPLYFVNAIASATRSAVAATDLLAVATDPRPATDSSAVLMSGGLDGAAPVAGDVTAQINAFNQADDINFISCPGHNTDFAGVTITKALETYGETRQDVMIIQDLPKTTPATGSGGAKDYVQNTANLASSYEAVFWPWIKRFDSVTGGLASFPPSPFVQGVIARVHAKRNFGKAPAGIIDGQILNAQDLETIIQENSAEYDDMHPAGVNAILKFAGQGFAIFGSKTMDPTGEFGQINVQIVFNINKRLARTKTRFVNFENNDTSTRAAVERVLTATFREQRLAGILKGTKDSEAFFVQCDEFNNTPLVIEKGKLICRVGLAVNRASEFVEFTFEKDTRAFDQALASQNV